MTARIIVAARVIANIDIAVQSLWVLHAARPAILLHEAPAARVVVPGAEVDEASLRVGLLPGEAEATQGGAPRPGRAPRLEGGAASGVASPVGDQPHATQPVALRVLAGRAHGPLLQARRAEDVLRLAVADHRAPGRHRLQAVGPVVGVGGGDAAVDLARAIARAVVGVGRRPLRGKPIGVVVSRAAPPLTQRGIGTGTGASR